jgi:hypothetical protein
VKSLPEAAQIRKRIDVSVLPFKGKTNKKVKT